ncbi:MAG: response regulator [Janthinobacterium lividum]
MLLVEDEPVIREIMAESLVDAGYDVVEAASGDEAMALIRARIHAFTILVTDFHMPGDSNGADVAACLRVEYPGLPVVIASGRPDVFKPAWRTELGYGLLRKPYVPRELVALIRQMTGKDGPVT